MLVLAALAGQSCGGGRAGTTGAGGGVAGAGGITGVGGSPPAGSGGSPLAGAAGNGTGGVPSGGSGGSTGIAGSPAGGSGGTPGIGGSPPGGSGGMCAGVCEDPEWAEWPITADAPPASAYATTVDTVTDTVTGLLWQRAAPPVRYKWDAAQTYCQNLSLGGRTGWRLPTRIELQSIVDYSRSKPAIEPTTFPSTQATNFWTSSAKLLEASTPLPFKWTVDFTDGATSFDDTDQAKAVRCVQCLCRASAPAARYTLTADTVFDTRTRLTWQRVIVDASSGGAYTPAEAKAHCQALTLAGPSPWRLPTVKELASLVDIRSMNPAWDTAAFPSISNWFAWASTPYAGDSSLGWTVGTGVGDVLSEDAIDHNVVRCVR